MLLHVAEMEKSKKENLEKNFKHQVREENSGHNSLCQTFFDDFLLVFGVEVGFPRKNKPRP